MFVYTIPSIDEGLKAIRLRETLDTLMLEKDYETLSKNIVTAVWWGWIRSLPIVEECKKPLRLDF